MNIDAIRTNAQVIALKSIQEEKFSPSRYPYTYAADFIRSHPNDYGNQLSRSDATQHIARQAASIGLNEENALPVYVAYADAYITEHSIDVSAEMRQKALDLMEDARQERIAAIDARRTSK